MADLVGRFDEEGRKVLGHGVCRRLESINDVVRSRLPTPNCSLGSSHKRDYRNCMFAVLFHFRLKPPRTPIFDQSLTCSTFK